LTDIRIERKPTTDGFDCGAFEAGEDGAEPSEAELKEWNCRIDAAALAFWKAMEDLTVVIDPESRVHFMLCRLSQTFFPVPGYSVQNAYKLAFFK